MPNDWFQFKRFIIHQDKCAMKVSTDACIQGAWAAKEAGCQEDSPKKILDIGTGTGLLSLMLAQALPDSGFDAIEINREAFLQASDNFNRSDWGHRLKSHFTSLAEFGERTAPGEKYNFIICNPPFFQNHLEATDKARNDARHSQSLSKEELSAAVYSLLSDNGIFCVLYPVTEWQQWLKTAASHQLYAYKQIEVCPKISSAANRIIGFFTKTQQDHTERIIFDIYNEDRSYASGMRALMKDYYLAL